jgi:hypothetical protein
VAAMNLVTTGCGRSWPTVRPVGDPDFMAQRRTVTSIDVLPVDVEVGVWQGSQEPVEDVSNTFYGVAEPTIQEALAGRGYRVATMIRWDGSFDRMDGGAAGRTLSEEQVQAVAGSMALYARAQSTHTDRLLYPYLPVKLGEATGADATLYVGGYAFAGDDPDPIDFGDVVKVVLIVAVIVVVIAIVAAGAKNGGGGGIGKAAGNAVQAGGRVIATVGRGALHLGAAALKASGRVLEVGARVAVEMNTCCWEYDPYYDDYGYYGPDAYGHEGVQVIIPIDPQQPPPQAPPVQVVPPPLKKMPSVGRSKTYIEMTLVDNRTGQVLWHARQEFNANPSKPGDARQVMLRMLKTIPQRGIVNTSR